MEEDPPPEDPFTEVRHKRPKTNSEADIIDANNLQQQLLNTNGFAALTTNQQQPPASVITSPAADGKKQPPLVVKNVSFAVLLEKMRSLKGTRPLYKNTRFGTKVVCASAEEFTTVQKYLQMCGYEYYTHDSPGNRPFRVVLRGLPVADPQCLVDRLKKDHNLVAQAAHIIKRKDEAQDECFYLLHFPKGYTTLKKLQEHKHVGQIIVRWEPYHKKRADVTQCTNCLHLGHGTRNCHLKARCNNCGDTHATDTCPKKDATEKRCANCTGAHQATDRQCPKRAEFIRIRKEATTLNQPGRKNRKTPPAPTRGTENFPPLSNSSVQADPPRFERPQPQQPSTSGSNQPRIDPRTRAGNYAHPQQERTSAPEGIEPPLFTAAECWAIFKEFTARMRQSKTRREQFDVIGQMVFDYGVY